MRMLHTTLAYCEPVQAAHTWGGAFCNQKEAACILVTKGQYIVVWLLRETKFELQVGHPDQTF